MLVNKGLLLDRLEESSEKWNKMEKNYSNRRGCVAGRGRGPCRSRDFIGTTQVEIS